MALHHMAVVLPPLCCAAGAGAAAALARRKQKLALRRRSFATTCNELPVEGIAVALRAADGLLPPRGAADAAAAMVRRKDYPVSGSDQCTLLRRMNNSEGATHTHRPLAPRWRPPFLERRDCHGQASAARRINPAQQLDASPCAAAGRRRAAVVGREEIATHFALFFLSQPPRAGRQRTLC